MIYLLIYRAVLCVHTFGQDEEEKWIEYRFSHYTGTIESSPSATEGYFPLFSIFARDQTRDIILGRRRGEPIDDPLPQQLSFNPPFLLLCTCSECLVCLMLDDSSKLLYLLYLSVRLPVVG